MKKNKFVKIEEEKEEFIIPENANISTLVDMIEELYLNKGKGRPSKEWKNNMNSLIDMVNIKSKIKMYQKIK